MTIGFIRTGIQLNPYKYLLPTFKPYHLQKRFKFSSQDRNLTMDAAPKKRPYCSACSKPVRVCLCSRFKAPLLDNSIAVTVLQHSLEKNHPLNSIRIASLGLKNLTVVTVSDVNTEAEFHIRLLKSKLSSEEEEKEEPLIAATVSKNGYTCSVLHQTDSLKPDFDQILASQVGQDAISNGFMVKKLQRKLGNKPNKKLDEEFEEQDEEFEIAVPPGTALLFPSKGSIDVAVVNFEVKHLIVLDGTWQKAKRIYYENPWLKLLPHLRLNLGKLSLYGEVRQQPKEGCLSTIESVVFAMKGLGHDQEGLDALLDVFESMVGDQRRFKDENMSRSQPRATRGLRL